MKLFWKTMANKDFLKTSYIVNHNYRLELFCKYTVMSNDALGFKMGCLFTSIWCTKADDTWKNTYTHNFSHTHYKYLMKYSSLLCTHSMVIQFCPYIQLYVSENVCNNSSDAFLHASHKARFKTWWVYSLVHPSFSRWYTS